MIETKVRLATERQTWNVYCEVITDWDAVIDLSCSKMRKEILVHNEICSFMHLHMSKKEIFFFSTKRLQ